MKRRDFLVSSAGFAAGALPLVGNAAATPCPPGTVAVAGGTTAQTACSASTGAADWATRSTAPGVVAAYDFSNPPANGGTWQWGSTSANPKVTVWGMNQQQSDVFPNRVRDTSIYPPGSTASLRIDVQSNSGERADAWRISLDNYADQFGHGPGVQNEFWCQWRQRWNAGFALTDFKARDGSSTGPKQLMVSAGMQSPYCAEGTPQAYYGYSPGASESNNVMAQARIDSDGEIVVADSIIPAMHPNNPTNLRYPGNLYLTKYFDDMGTRGRNLNYFTYMNEGNESAHSPCACEYTQPGGVGNQWTDYTTCFTYTPDTWITLMSHVILGPWGTQSIGGVTRTGYTNSIIELWGAYPGQTMRLLHRRTWPLAQYNGPQQGAQGVQRYGQFGFTTFMTSKDPAHSHPLASTWFGQIIVKAGSTPIPAPIA